ncbi:MAG: hypothetical protein A2934_02270, partial [Candidatus Sungbacteria bacterium RIFCSPLOWO2_01_FULL_47_10]
MLVFKKHVRPYPKTAGIIFLSIIAVSVLEMAGAWYSKKLFDMFTNQNLPREIVITSLVAIAIAFYGYIKGLGWMFHRFWGFANIYFEVHIMKDLEITALENLLGHSYRFFTNNFTGSLVRKVRRLSRAFEDVADNVEGNLLPLAITIVGVLAMLFHRHFVLGIILLVWVGGFVILYYRIAIWKLKYDLEKAEKDSESTGVLSDILTNIVTIKLFARSGYEKERFTKTIGELTRLRFKTWTISTVTDALQGLLMIIINAAIVLVALRLWNEGRLTIGDFALIEEVILALFHRIWDFGRVVRRIYESLADASGMVEILNTPHEVEDHPDATSMRVGEGKIEFKHVDFGFHDTKKILDAISLTIAPGEKVALVGSSGAGKTTVVSLLERFHDIPSGEILIDGQNIAGVTQDSLRQNISFVPQEPILFHQTLKENIRYGKLDAADEEVVEAAQKARCHDFISSLPCGYDTFVGERGVKLSGGERQRVVIARAILANKPILILDEATSSLDSEVESLIQEALRELMKSKTTIV